MAAALPEDVEPVLGEEAIDYQVPPPQPRPPTRPSSLVPSTHHPPTHLAHPSHPHTHHPPPLDPQKLIVDGVRSQLDGDEARLNEFVAMTRNYGKVRPDGRASGAC